MLYSQRPSDQSLRVQVLPAHSFGSCLKDIRNPFAVKLLIVQDINLFTPSDFAQLAAKVP